MQKIKTVSCEENYLRDMIRDAELVHACAMAKCKGCAACTCKPEPLLMLRLLKEAAQDFLEKP